VAGDRLPAASFACRSPITGHSMARAIPVFLATLIATNLFAAAPRPYHLSLQATPAATLPLLAKFGTVDIDVYSGGIRAQSLWLDAFSRNASSVITLINPVARMYADVPIEQFPALIAHMTGSVRNADVSPYVPKLSPPVGGKVGGIDARRYRLVYGPDGWIDIWTTTIVPENPQLKKIVQKFVRDASPATADLMLRIPGNPIYVELSSSDHPKLPIVQLRFLRFDTEGEARALRVGSYYFKAPLDVIWK
jgi:hypothetical protein